MTFVPPTRLQQMPRLVMRPAFILRPGRLKRTPALTNLTRNCNERKNSFAERGFGLAKQESRDFGTFAS